MFSSIFALSLFLSAAVASPTVHQNSTLNAPRKVGKRCTGQIQSLSDVAAAQECTTIVIGGFTVPAGETFALSPPDGAQISLTGEITFGFKAWAGPLMQISGNDITFDAGGHVLNGQGSLYWDGQGGNGGIEKPAPMLTLNMGGTFTNVKISESPQRAVAVNGNGLTVSDVTVDNSAGTAPNSLSGGSPAGANTDGFDVAANDVTITGCTVNNQDDCLAINRGSSITFSNNVCEGIGHGISIGSISSGATVNGVTISGNTVTGTVNGLRIKTDATATGSIVENVIYENNKLTGITSFGVLIDQSYPATLGTPGTGVVIENVNFEGTNTITVGSSAHRVEVNCGSTSSCTGTWNFAGLTVTGGTGSTIKNAPVTGGSF
ncbi:glycoside hydrolase family 28 protein [Collybiopsis luxurians FD-317 M1]|uniref:endo-polygalacturonase n=1 Tax=Collybiopsis luxurians FD-317 M1 TaxID=944289 RepID=A0A0D0BBM1_9AGAR|nr:glycoside hydrolase family 28 protein [Collybiopsis luxurians FD-317 M1]